MEVFHELTEISPDCNKTDLMREILSKMKCLMSDRAATMKSFDKKLSAFKKEYLGKDDDSCSTHFLFCNAHFLLGLSKAAEDAVHETEQTIKAETQLPLGRDNCKSFARFSGSTESAACRLIRLSAEVFGPRGHEQNGCRLEWQGYCDEISVSSRFTSFRGNRFKNLFENAAAVIYHLDHIEVFLEQFVSHSNLKLQSILADLKDKNVVSIVGALALFNLLVTEGYWKLMNSAVPYGAFKYVKILHSALQDFANDSTLLTDCCKPVFPDFATDDASTLEFINSVSSEIATSSQAFRNIATKSIDVLERQLEDFLDGGVFGGRLDEEVQQVLDTCPLTNLVGERLFGDLDYDMGKRRHSGLHHRSTLNMWKHNRTGKWLSRLQPTDLKYTLQLASKDGSKLRDKHREAEKLVKGLVKERIKSNARERKAKDIRQSELKASILDSIISQGGQCRTKEDVDQLFRRGTANDLKNQLRYRKVILGEKHVKVSGSAKTLYSNLMQAIEGGSSDALPPRKKARIENDSASTSIYSKNEL